MTFEALKSAKDGNVSTNSYNPDSYQKKKYFKMKIKTEHRTQKATKVNKPLVLRFKINPPGRSTLWLHKLGVGTEAKQNKVETNRR